MKCFTFENQGTNTYLVYQIAEDDTVDSMSLGMLTNNKIPGLATTIFTQMDTAKYIKYNVSSRVSVTQFFTGAVNRRRLLGVFRGIVNALMSAEDYMIDTGTIMLDLDYIFTDVSTCETVLICVPIEQKIEQCNLGAFFKGIMFETQFDQTESCDYVAHIINYLNSTPLFSLEDFKLLLENEENAVSGASVSTSAAQKSASAPQEQPKIQNVSIHQQNLAETKSVQKSVVLQKKSNQKPENRVVVPPMPESDQKSEDTEKKLSMLGLLMHYSKENAELYKKQKADKKAEKGMKNTQAESSKKNKKNTESGTKFSQGFAIPGQTVPEAQPMVQPTISKHSEPVYSQIVTTATDESVSASQSAYVSRQASQGQTAGYGDTTYLGNASDGQTTVLVASNHSTHMITPHLIRKKNNEKISLNKPVFRVGKERSYVDYFLGDNTAISRSHANFVNREGAYFVVDTNSTNHTFVNGTMIQSNVETVLSHGDMVRLANEDFEFRLY